MEGGRQNLIMSLLASISSGFQWGRGDAPGCWFAYSVKYDSLSPAA